MAYDDRYSRTTTNNRPGRRAPPSYLPPPRGSRSSHSVFGYWVPLVVTGTIAIGGLAAWIWSERSDSEEDDYPHDKPPRPQTGVGAAYPTQGSQPYPGPPAQDVQSTGYAPPPSMSAGPPPGGPSQMSGGEASSYYNSSQSQSRDVQYQQQDEATWYARMSGAIRRTPSPQQFFDSATKQVSTGLAAAGAALGSIMEGSDEERDRNAGAGGTSSGRRSSKRPSDRVEEKEGFSDHERWSEEADDKQRAGPLDAESERRAEAARITRDEKGKGRSRKAVAVVVSADTNATVELEHEESGFITEHASILSHLPARHDTDSTDLFVLIYAPGLKSLPPTNYQPRGNPTSTAGSTYSNISTPAVTPGSELQSISPRVDAADSPSKTFAALYQQALVLVSSPTRIMPFTTPEGYVHILRHLAPKLVYISDTLSGDEGEGVAQLKGWVGHTVLVAGEGGHGGLADTETETEDEQRDGGRREKVRKWRWYENSSFVGLGKEVEVVDAGRVGEDWSRRVGGRE